MKSGLGSRGGGGTTESYGRQVGRNHIVKEKVDVVTGGAGFIGSHLCRALLGQGRRVRVVDNFSTGSRENLSQFTSGALGDCEIFEQDIRRGAELLAVFAGAETVYHQAAMVSVQESIEDPVKCNSINGEGTLAVLTAARDAGVGKVIFASSSAVYGDSEIVPNQEGMQIQPISPYAVSKYVGELYCKLFSDIYNLPTVALRYFNVFGPRQSPGSDYAAVIPRFVDRMLADQRPMIFGDGEQSRDFVFVEDVVAANLRAAQSTAGGVTCNIACGRRFTLNQLVDMLNTILGCGLKPIYRPARVGDVRHSGADISRAAKAIGFHPALSFEEGLKRTVRWFENE